MTNPSQHPDLATALERLRLVKPAIARNIDQGTPTREDLQALQNALSVPDYAWVRPLALYARRHILGVVEPVDDEAGLTIRNLETGKRQEFERFRKIRLLPEMNEAKRQRDRDRGVSRIHDLMRRQAQPIKEASFTHVSAEGQFLGPVYYAVAASVLKLQQEDAKFATWVNSQGNRPLFLRQNLNAIQADRDIPQYIHAFEETFSRADQGRAKTLFECLPRFTPEHIALLAYTLDQESSWSNVEKYIAQCLLQADQQGLPNLMEDWIDQKRQKVKRESPKARDALNRLKAKVERLNQPKPVEQPIDNDFADFDEALDADIAAGKDIVSSGVKEAPEETLTGTPEQRAAASSLQKLMEGDPQRFIEQYFRPAIQAQYESLGLDPRGSLRILGAGATNMVIEAEHEDFGPVAIRADVKGLTSDEHAYFNLRGASILSRLQHPGIVKSLHPDVYTNIPIPVQSKGKTTRIFLTVQYLEHLGEARLLSDMIKELGGRSPNAEAVQRFGARLSSALAYCHEKKAVHRDIKPDNVMVKKPKRGEPRDVNNRLMNGQSTVLDFGLARETTQKEGSATLAKDTGGIVGTLPYLSPRAIRENTKSRNPSNDVFGLSILLYELITGQIGFHPAQHSYRGQFPGFRRDQKSEQYSATLGIIDCEDPEALPIIAIDDPKLKTFLKEGGMIAKLIIQFISSMSNPNPKRQPTMAQVNAFFDRPVSHGFRDRLKK